MLRDVDPVAAVERLDRMRGAAIAHEYTCLAGVSRGRRRIWSGRPGIWYDAHVIDLGRRPETGRMAPEETPENEPLPATVDNIMAVFRRRDNQPARVADIADALGSTKNQVYKRLERTDRFRKISRGAGNSANYYVPASVAVDATGVEYTLSPTLRKLYETLAERGRMPVDELMALTGLTNPSIHRACKQRPDIFAKEVKVVTNKHGSRRAYVWLVDHNETEGTK